MEEERSWTTDLTKSYEVFCRHYPEKSKYMQQALDWTTHPTNNTQELKNFLNTFGKWLTEEMHIKLSF